MVDLVTALDLSEIGNVLNIWKEYAKHPSIDPDVRVRELQETPDTSPCILALRDKGKVIGMVIGIIREMEINFRLKYWTIYRSRARVIQVLGRGIIMEREQPELINIFLSFINNLLVKGIADYVHFACIPQNSILRSFLRKEFLTRLFEKPLEPRFMLEISGLFDEVLKRLSSKERKNIKYLEKRVHKALPNIRVKTILDDASEAKKSFNDVLSVHAKTYQHKLNISPLSSSNVKSWWDRLCESNRMIITLIYDGAKPIAFLQSHIYGEIANALTTGYDPSYKDTYVGNWTFIRHINTLCELNKLTLLDYGIGKSMLKERLSNKINNEGHILLFSNRTNAIRLKHAMVTLEKLTNLIDSILERVGMKEAINKIIRKVGKF